MSPRPVPVVAAGERHAVDAVLEVLAAGGVVALPTDTVYGVAALPAVPSAVAALFAVKERPVDVALPVLVGELAQVPGIAAPLAGVAAELARRFWPGPLTLVVRRSPGFVADLGGPPERSGTVGVRWPDHGFVAATCRRAGPLAVTSANRHGAPPCTTARDVLAAFGDGRRPDLVVDGGTCAGEPSTVVDCTGEVPRCLRPGALAWEELTGGS
ncbi:MAG: L-threonylcarbamoyladenylate synthase [Actinomycetota bacterium]|nr:L-threonylcarbamoyladenylate synthase [Actinomycetota bacterium]